MAEEDNKNVLDEEKKFHKRVISSIGNTSLSFGKLMGQGVKKVPEAGAGLVSGVGRTARHPLFFLIISMLLYFVDVGAGFQRVGLMPWAWFISPFFWMYLVFVIVVVLILKLSWGLDESQIGMFIGVYLFVWIFPSLKGIGGFIPNWIFVLAGLAGPVYFMFILPHEQTTVEKWISVVFVILLVVIFLDSISEVAKDQMGQENVDGIKTTEVRTANVISKAINSLIGLPGDIKEGTNKLIENTKKAWQRQIAFGTGDYYVGNVDQNANEKLGVFIEDIKSSEPVVYEGEPISIWATLKARTLGDEIVNVNVSCKTKDTKNNEIKGYTDVGKKGEVRKFEIAKMEEEDIDCNFDKYKLDKGTYDIKFNANFNFQTMAYLKTYFINKERQRSLTMDNIDVFEQYGITDTEPTAIYTNGPVKIGMETTQPLTGLSTDYDNKPRLGITLDNGWEGKIKRINNLVVYIPEYIEIGECLDSFEQYTNIKEDEKQEGYYAYKLKDDVKDSRRFKDIELFITINCRLNIPINKVNQFLGKTPITTKYFKVTVDYEYELEKGISINIKEPKDFSVRIKETNPTSGKPLNCYGKHPDKKLKSAECSFYEVRDERENEIANKVPARCIDKECNCILNEGIFKTKKGQIIKCKMIATNEKGEKESDSDSIRIVNSPPEIKEISINDGKDVIVNNDLICKAIIEDNDNDIITATYEFSGDYAETGKASCSGDTCTAKIDGFKIIEGASITCKIVPNDGIDNGKEKTKTVTVKGV